MIKWTYWENCEVATGCSDPEAENYYCNTPEGNMGCLLDMVYIDIEPTPELVFLYDELPLGFIDDGSCVYPDLVCGCTDPSAINGTYNPFQSLLDISSQLSHIFPMIYGKMVTSGYLENHVWKMVMKRRTPDSTSILKKPNSLAFVSTSFKLKYPSSASGILKSLTLNFLIFLIFSFLA